eukprot:TRINITY_DN8976_c0_g1_i2.p1 TRINITY_DN8976_c0_g1~~TRINITY_DN8976_c0_g1_i2.p1  ORF type:complete len:305 (+),score=28.95 TRINITY_DN8976_c0_g1_i2:73-987(+)
MTDLGRQSSILLRDDYESSLPRKFQLFHISLCSVNLVFFVTVLILKLVSTNTSENPPDTVLDIYIWIGGLLGLVISCYGISLSFTGTKDSPKHSLIWLFFSMVVQYFLGGASSLLSGIVKELNGMGIVLFILIWMQSLFWFVTIVFMAPAMQKKQGVLGFTLRGSLKRRVKARMSIFWHLCACLIFFISIMSIAAISQSQNFTDEYQTGWGLGSSSVGLLVSFISLCNTRRNVLFILFAVLVQHLLGGVAGVWSIAIATGSIHTLSKIEFALETVVVLVWITLALRMVPKADVEELDLYEEEKL